MAEHVRRDVGTDPLADRRELGADTTDATPDLEDLVARPHTDELLEQAGRSAERRTGVLVLVGVPETASLALSTSIVAASPGL